MGFQWHLAPYLAAQGVSWEQLDERLGFRLPPNLRGVVPPVDLTLPVLADLCQTLGCQPGELLTFEPDTLAQQAERQLASNQTYQSFLDFQASKKSELF